MFYLGFVRLRDTVSFWSMAMSRPISSDRAPDSGSVNFSDPG